MTSHPTRRRTFKIVLLGSQSVGKSSLIVRFHKDTFDGLECSTIGQTYVIHHLNVAHEDVQLNIWDTPGQEKFASASTLVVRDAHCCIIVYDVTNQMSFQELTIHRDRYVNSCVLPETLSVIAANKIDLLTTEQRREECDKLVAYEQTEKDKVFMVSAKTGEQVQDLFEYCAENILERFNAAVAPHLGPKLEPGELSAPRPCC
jgi:small GTP-binding protein